MKMLQLLLWIYRKTIELGNKKRVSTDYKNGFSTRPENKTRYHISLSNFRHERYQLFLRMEV